MDDSSPLILLKRVRPVTGGAASALADALLFSPHRAADLPLDAPRRGWLFGRTLQRIAYRRVADPSEQGETDMAQWSRRAMAAAENRISIACESMPDVEGPAMLIGEQHARPGQYEAIVELSIHGLHELPDVVAAQSTASLAAEQQGRFSSMARALIPVEGLWLPFEMTAGSRSVRGAIELLRAFTTRTYLAMLHVSDLATPLSVGHSLNRLVRWESPMRQRELFKQIAMIREIRAVHAWSPKQ